MLHYRFFRSEFLGSLKWTVICKGLKRFFAFLTGTFIFKSVQWCSCGVCVFCPENVEMNWCTLDEPLLFLRWAFETVWKHVDKNEKVSKTSQTSQETFSSTVSTLAISYRVGCHPNASFWCHSKLQRVGTIGWNKQRDFWCYRDRV